MKLEPLALTKTLFLAFIERKPNITGYELKKLVFEFTKGALELKSGHIYSELRNLEKQGFLSSYLVTDTRKKRCYTITENGKKELKRLYTLIKDRIENVLLPLLALIEGRSSV